MKNILQDNCLNLCEAIGNINDNKDLNNNGNKLNVNDLFIYLFYPHIHTLQAIHSGGMVS